MKHKPYTCVRCGYETYLKDDIRKHMYKRKKPCPCTVTTIEITDEIKEWILENRIYSIPKEKPVTITQTINNYNTINNMIISMAPMDKITKLCKIQNLHIKNLEYSIGDHFDKKNEKMLEPTELDAFYQIGKDDIHDAIDKVTRCKRNDFSDFCIIFDSKLNRLMVRNESKWMEMSVSKGIKYIINLLKEFHLDNYEVFLVRYIEKSAMNTRMVQKGEELLKEYYSFIACFELLPYVNTCSSSFIDGKTKEEIEDNYLPKYNKVMDTTSISKQKQFKSQVLETIKKNGKSNIADLNAYLLNLIQVDQEFKDKMLSSFV